MNCISNNLEKAMATHSSTLAWRIPWTEEPGRLQSMGLWRVGNDRETSLSLFTFMHWRSKWHRTPALAWRIPGTGEPGALPSMGSHRVGHDWSDLVVVVDKWFIQTAWKEQTKTEGFYRCPRGEKSLALKWTEFPSDKTDTLFLSSNISTGFLNM